VDICCPAVWAVIFLSAIGDGVVILVVGVSAEFLINALKQDHITFTISDHFLETFLALVEND
jgi:hypothetical protein